MCCLGDGDGSGISAIAAPSGGRTAGHSTPAIRARLTLSCGSRVRRSLAADEERSSCGAVVGPTARRRRPAVASSRGGRCRHVASAQHCHTRCALPAQLRSTLLLLRFHNQHPVMGHRSMCDERPPACRVRISRGLLRVSSSGVWGPMRQESALTFTEEAPFSAKHLEPSCVVVLHQRTVLPHR